MSAIFLLVYLVLPGACAALSYILKLADAAQPVAATDMVEYGPRALYCIAPRTASEAGRYIYPD